MLNQTTIEILEKYHIDYKDMSEEEIQEILGGIKEVEERINHVKSVF